MESHQAMHNPFEMMNSQMSQMMGQMDRLMGGGGGKKKKSKRASEPSELSQAERDRTGAGSSGKKPGEDSVSVRGARPVIRL